MTLEDSILIAAPADDLFALTQNYARRLAWDPFLRAAVPWDASLSPRVGWRVRCVSWYRVAMDVEYVSYHPARVAAVRMVRGPWCLRRFAGAWLFRETTPGETRVSFRYHFLIRPAFLTRLGATLFARDTRKRLEALKTYAESQRYVGSPLVGLVSN